MFDNTISLHSRDGTWQHSLVRLGLHNCFNDIREAAAPYVISR